MAEIDRSYIHNFLPICHCKTTVV